MAQTRYEGSIDPVPRRHEDRSCPLAEQVAQPGPAQRHVGQPVEGRAVRAELALLLARRRQVHVAPAMRQETHVLRQLGQIGRRVGAFTEKNPDAPIIKLGIGDVTEPIVPAVLDAIRRGVDEMGERGTFRGYGPERGYRFLIDAIIEHDFGARGVTVAPDEVFVSDGSKCDSGNIQEIFALDNVMAVVDPVYPVYVDTNVMAGRSGAIDD